MAERDYDSEMRLPEGRTCGDCFHFKKTCEWLVSHVASDTKCDWWPSKFMAIKP